MSLSCTILAWHGGDCKLLPLREKYRPGNATPSGPVKNVTLPEKAYIWRAQRFRPNPGQPGNGRSGQFGAFTLNKSKRPKTRPRRRAYGPFWRAVA